MAVLLALLWSGVCGAQIDNPSFEESYASAPAPRPFPSYWTPFDQDAFNSKCTTLWSTDGVRSAILYSRAGTLVFAEEYASIWQYVDLTGVNYLAFDAMLLADVAGGFGPFEASFRVNDTVLWSETAEGEYLDQLVDVSAFTDWCMVELRITALAEWTSGAESGAFWDNLAFSDGPAIPTLVGASITLTPDTLVVGCDPWWRKHAWGNCGHWVTCFIELEEGFDARLIDGSTVLLEDIPAYTGRDWWARPEANRANLFDLDRDGVLERMVRFDRDAIEEIVGAPETEVTIQGLLLDGTPFEGTAVIQVVEKGWRTPPRPVCKPARKGFTWRYQPPACGKKK